MSEIDAAASVEEGVPPVGALAAAEPAAESEPEPEPESEPEPEPEPEPVAAAPAAITAPAGLESSVLTGQRVPVLEDLLAMGREFMRNFESYKVMAEDPARGHQARKCYFQDTQLPVTLVRLRADGFTLEHVAKFYGGFDTNLPIMVPEMTLTPLCVDEGAATRWFRMKPPKPLSPRTLVTSSYKVFNPEDGSFIWIVSSRGNDAIYDAEVGAKRIKAKDVRATVHIDFNHFLPSEDGKSMICHKIMCMDVGGNVPEIAKKKMAKRQVEGHQGLIDWCLLGKVPEPL
jgi:hypothetical protein